MCVVRAAGKPLIYGAGGVGWGQAVREERVRRRMGALSVARGGEAETGRGDHTRPPHHEWWEEDQGETATVWAPPGGALTLTRSHSTTPSCGGGLLHCVCRRGVLVVVSRLVPAPLRCCVSFWLMLRFVAVCACVGGCVCRRGHRRKTRRCRHAYVLVFSFFGGGGHCRGVEAGRCKQGG